MKKLAVALALLLAACGTPNTPASISLYPVRQAPKQYAIFAFESGDATVEFDRNPEAVQHVLELVRQGYYNGAWIYNAAPGGMVQFGESYWQGAEPGPRWLVPMSSLPRTDLAGSEVALPVLARPTSSTLIVGPQLILTHNFNLNNRLTGADMLPIGRVTRGGENIATARKGDKILSAVIGRVIP